MKPLGGGAEGSRSKGAAAALVAVVGVCQLKKCSG
jgi:hypothetical protein